MKRLVWFFFAANKGVQNSPVNVGDEGVQREGRWMSFVLSPYCPTIVGLETACNAHNNDQ